MSLRMIPLLVLLASIVGAPAQADWRDLLKKGAEALTQPQSGDGGAGGLAPEQIVAGLREALKVGSERVVAQIGVTDGFNADPAIHIPLPPELRNVQEMLRRVGLSALADEVELKINRAAEAAMPETKALIWDAITAMTLDDAKAILDGPDDAATRYFQRVSGPRLADVVRPVVDRALAEVGAVAAYDSLVGQYSALPFVPDLKGDLRNHAVDGALAGLYHYLAAEEAEIRKDPAARTTEILKTVFGG